MQHPSCFHTPSPHVPWKESMLAFQVRWELTLGERSRSGGLWEQGRGGLSRAGRTLGAQGEAAEQPGNP